LYKVWNYYECAAGPSSVITTGESFEPPKVVRTLATVASLYVIELLGHGRRYDQRFIFLCRVLSFSVAINPAILHSNYGNCDSLCRYQFLMWLKIDYFLIANFAALELTVGFVGVPHSRNPTGSFQQ
jgi:hypothetical protein